MFHKIMESSGMMNWIYLVMNSGIMVYLIISVNF